MSNYFRWAMWAGALIVVLAAPRGVSAQGNPDPYGFRFNSGQGIQPIFEGWAKNPDGSYAMYFGYMNRNYVETLEVPVGPENKLEPGTADRGQPTFFNTRIHRLVFKVSVPKDWGKKELVWSLTVRGKTEQAIAWLQPEWEIDPINAGKTLSEEQKRNKPPVMTVSAPATATLSSPLKLDVAVQDDGLPTPPKGPRKQAVGQETPPTLKPLPDQPEVPVNVPQLAEAGRGRGGRGGPQGLIVTWIVYRGPAAVTFDPAGPVAVKDGKANVTATFAKPGTYWLRGRAFDGQLADEKDITVTVK
jgi:hypothetical protein